MSTPEATQMVNSATKLTSFWWTADAIEMSMILEHLGVLIASVHETVFIITTSKWLIRYHLLEIPHYSQHVPHLNCCEISVGVNEVAVQ